MSVSVILMLKCVFSLLNHVSSQMSSQDLLDEIKRREQLVVNLVEEGKKKATLRTEEEMRMTERMELGTTTQTRVSKKTLQPEEGDEVEYNAEGVRDKEDQEDIDDFFDCKDDEEEDKGDKGKRDKGDKGDDEMEENNEDEKGDDGDDTDLDEVESFNWKSKKFVVKWSNGKNTSSRATDVITDWPEEALKVLWRDHRGNSHMRRWIDRIMVMTLKRRDYIDLHSYAAQHGWEGSLEAREGNLEASLEGNLETQKMSLEAMNDIGIGIAVGIEHLLNKEDNISPDINGGGNTINTNTEKLKKVGDAVRSEKPCAMTHDWEEMYTPGYSSIRGKSCINCSIPFMELPKICNLHGYWPSSKDIVHRCKTCGFAWCHPCKIKRDVNSPSKNKRTRRFR